MKHHTLAAAVVLALAIARPAVADTGWHIWQSGTVGCELRSDVEQILNLPTTDDLRALLRELLMSGRCFLLAKGTEVVISSMSEDIVAVRQPNETAYLYVDRWAVQGPGGEPSE
jgi:hypothetical protein